MVKVPTEVREDPTTVTGNIVPVNVAAFAVIVLVSPRFILVPLIVKEELASWALSTPEFFIVTSPELTLKSPALKSAIPFTVVSASLIDAVTVPSILP